jgi:hypothetical protein
MGHDQVAPVAYLLIGVGEGLKRGPLRHRARPGRSSTVEVEVVLPPQPPASPHRQRDQLSQHLSAAVLKGFAGAAQPLGLAEATELLQFDPLTRVVLPDKLGTGELNALPVGQRRPGLPVLNVAIERQEEHRKPRRG